MARRTKERRLEIVRMVTADGRVCVADLAKVFSVSEVTIRVDLNELGKRGKLFRTRGGAIANSRVCKELTLGQREARKPGIKHAIALRACEFIEDGDSLILDSGSTTAEVARNLGHHARLSVITNGFNIAQILAAHDGVDLIVTGGTLRKSSMSFFGAHAEDCLSRYRFDKLIMSADGFDLTDGITTLFEHEASLNRKMCASAKKIIVVVDSSKFNRTGLHKIRDLGAIDVVITDDGIPDIFVRSLRANGIELVIVNNSAT